MTRPRIEISVARDFSRTPGARFIEDGPFSAEVFYNDHVQPAFQRALDTDQDLFIDLDGVSAYATSFLQGTFGTLAHDFTTETVRERMSYKHTDDPILNPLIERYITEAHRVEKTYAVAA